MMDLIFQRRQELSAVNADINKLPYRVDVEQYGLPDFWIEMDDGGGDCEDYALVKRAKLRELGWAKEDLDICICEIQGDGHAVLVAHTSEGDFVLDSYGNPPVYRWGAERPGYVWIKTTIGGTFRSWRSLKWPWVWLYLLERWWREI